MRKLFGTDGIRGVANDILTPELAFSLSQATSQIWQKKEHHRPYIFIGKDTRHSGSMLESAMAAGFCSMGYDVHLLGEIPTPGVAWFVKNSEAMGGVMISASSLSMKVGIGPSPTLVV